MLEKIETAAELRDAVNAAAAAGHIDVRIKTGALREALKIADTIRDWEIHAAVTASLRSDENPEVVFTLGGGMIASQIHVPVDGSYSIGDELWRVAGDLSDLHGGKVWVTPAPNSAYGYGILTAYRMPAGEYGAGDWALVERFGVEHGKYQQSRDRVAY
ncbi:hypothetical protein [Antarcticirhabdus aurantiaca]|uniref:Uncharacterized protein n=1 Tax=Antarcticirhabdus aurantiaca TaxID=2606717 RepID=A0ACD4NRT8_9HYPH|nr:hypothetical protein [Antarcticirhabdus aurantiaca]WAJ29418.1 hypothetical protein OXU80_04045 [Jeongeuplla avenae]